MAGHAVIAAPALGLLPVSPGEQGLGRYAAATGSRDRHQALTRLAGAIAADSAWLALRPRIVVHPTRPLLGVLGPFTSEQLPILQAQARAVPGVLRHVRYASYEQVHAVSRELACRLSAALGAERLRAARFVGVPRGGLAVLSILSYLLELRPDQLSAEPDDRPLVVVDDCAYSGYRADQFLRALPGGDVTLALLYAPGPLPASLQAAFPRLHAVVVARELEVIWHGGDGDTDRAPVPGGMRHWWGRAEHLGFPWTEPERLVWSPTTGTWEGGWPLFPPELCLKHAARSEAATVEVQSTGVGPLRPAERALFGEAGGTVIVLDADTGSSVALEGTSAEIWDALLRTGTREGIVAELVRRYDVSEATARDDVEAVVGGLDRRGLVEGA